MKTPTPAPPKEAQMLCWLLSGELDCVFLEDYEGKPMQPASPAPPREAQMLCWLASGEHEAVQIETLQLFNLRTLLFPELGHRKMEQL